MTKYSIFNITSAQQNPQCVHGAILVPGNCIPVIPLWVLLCINNY